MAANDFAIFLNKNTNKMTKILIYTLLEWILIILLLLNSLISYLIIKFADYFGLKTPCPMCSKIDHVFEPGKSHKFHRDLLCETHSVEISKLGYCSNHKKLAESENLCIECSFSERGKVDGFCEVAMECSCCGFSLEREDYSPFLMIKPNLDFLAYGKNDDDVEIGDSLKGDLFELEKNEEKGSNLMIKDPSFADDLAQIGENGDVSAEILSHHLDFFVGRGGYRLIPVELIGSAREENRGKEREDKNCELFGENFDFQIKFEDGFEMGEENEGGTCAVNETLEMKENQTSLSIETIESEFWGFYNENEKDGIGGGKEYEPNASSAVKEDEIQNPDNEAEAEVSIGTEIPDLELTDEMQNPENLPIKDLNAISDNAICEVTNIKVSSGSDLSDIGEDKVPDTPTSIDSLHQLHKKLLMLEQRESGAEESLDGSIASELECGDGVPTVDELKLALKAERKALQALYAELEEERSASAIAANQTMAMITRIQEEKAAMQMEALQYQRMMDEQSEYDQEALQLLNELMVKREKEKQELERELEVYRKKVLEYEGKERFMLLRKSREGSVKSESLSGCSSNNGDGEGVVKEDVGFQHDNGNHNTPIDEVLGLDEPLGHFEEERIMILGQLKALEEKLFTMSDEEDGHFEDIKPIEHFYEENGLHSYGLGNGFHEKTNPEGRIKGVKGKRLLPLFDEMSDDNEEKIDNVQVNGYLSNEFEYSKFENGDSGNKMNGIEEDIVQLYERLQALEEDREFLKHCISSLKKGDKGMDLLQEILQHLRDLRNVDNRIVIS